MIFTHRDQSYFGSKKSPSLFIRKTVRKKQKKNGSEIKNRKSESRFG
jgi:hypothetical protein